ADRAGEDRILHERRAPLDRRRHLELPSARHDGVDQLSQRAERADPAAVEPPPQDRRRDGEQRERIPREVVREDRQARADRREDMRDRQELTLEDAEIEHREHERRILQRPAAPREADQRESGECGDETDVERLVACETEPGRRVVELVEAPRIGFAARSAVLGACRRREEQREHGREHWAALAAARTRSPAAHRSPGGSRYARAMRLALLRTARLALVTVTVARVIASMSSPTRKRSRTLLPANCRGNAGRSTEKYPYGSRCSTTTMPVSTPDVSMPTSILIGPS